MKIFAAILLLSVATVASSASQTIVRQEPPRVEALTTAPSVWGDGKMPCSTWSAAAAGRTDPSQISWTLGYLSAVAATGERLRPVSDSYVQGWIAGHCGRRPSVTIATATRELVAYLKTP